MDKKPKPKTLDPRRPRRRKSEDDAFAASNREKENESRLKAWVPKTDLGKKVKNGDIDSLEHVFDQGHKILEPEIVDSLMSHQLNKTVELKKTARVVASGRQFSYRATVLIGNGNGFVGVGIGSDRERVPAMQKAGRNAKMNLVRVYRGCGSWECVCGLNHSLPFAMKGKMGSVRVKLSPAPRGLGLAVGEQIKDVLRFAGIADAWSQTTGRSKTTLNFVKAAVDALGSGSRMRQSDEIARKIGRAEKRTAEGN
ncbi:MAG: 30S ribosomal protein S5 [Candidatus Diapherotrites archaeon]|nr:30S ribosomal protein S5 [Candidatus Diapherotrites archaeon]